MNASAGIEPGSPAPNPSLWRRLRLVIRGLALSIGYIVLIVASCMLLHDGVVRAVSKLRQEHDHIQTLVSSSTAIDRVGDGSEARDFDGDGTPDQLYVESFRVEPYFGRKTTDLVRVNSGRTGELLLSHPALFGLLMGEGWCGDYDGNGTEDIVLNGWGRWIVLGYVPD